MDGKLFKEDLMKNQRQKILAYMKKHKSITRREAAFLGIMELSSRIIELRERDGVKINSEWVDVVSSSGEKIRVKKYWLEDE